ncbi:MAG TPA: hypothetical protein VK573_02540 [Gemmatimonadales bacterium]|nr:hypothetical protein [Gemmatimonadales bacterium]
MMRLRFVLAGTAVLIAVSACAGRSSGGAPPRDRNLITQDELSERNFTSLLHAIEALRGNWLSLRGPDGRVQVYVDQVHIGGVDILRTIPVTSVLLIRHMDGIEATARFGRDHYQGAILISTRASAPP